MIIATEDGTVKGPPKRVNPYQENPWLQPQNPHVPGQNPQDPQNNWNQPGQNMPETITEPTLPPIVLTTTPSPPKSSTKPPFPRLDDIDWTQFLDKTTQRPSGDGLSSAIDGEGVLEPRDGGR